MKKKISKCKFNKRGKCISLACYDACKCSAKDKKGNPKYKCEHIWEGDSFRGVDILGKAKTIRWSVCIKCGAIIGIQSIEEVKE